MVALLNERNADVIFLPRSASTILEALRCDYKKISKGTSTAGAQRGRECPREAPRRGDNQKEAGTRRGGATPRTDFPNSIHTHSPGARRRDANSHQLEARRLPPNLPPNEETSPLGGVQPFNRRTHFRFRGTRSVPSLRGRGARRGSLAPTDLRRSLNTCGSLVVKLGGDLRKEARPRGAALRKRG